MTRALLDVNVLLALVDPDHVDHDRAVSWLTIELTRPDAAGWASCPLTQNGFVRVISQPRYPNALSTPEALDVLATVVANDAHEFWPDDRSVVDAAVIDRSRVLGPRQVTDAYLLALAASRGGRFVTFDRRITIDAVVGARADQLVTI